MNTHNNKNKQPSTAEKAGQPSTAKKAGQPSHPCIRSLITIYNPPGDDGALQSTFFDMSIFNEAYHELLKAVLNRSIFNDAYQKWLIAVLNMSIFNDAYGKKISEMDEALMCNEYLGVLILKNTRQVLSSLSLVILNLEWNIIGDRGVQKLVDALSGIKTLEVLNLAHNMIGPEGAEYLASLLRTNNTLLELNLGGNMLRDQGTQYIAKGLLENTTLRIFKIPNNYIKSDVIEILSLPLEQGCISHLDISVNKIDLSGDPSHNSINYIPYMPMLEILDISGNHVTSSGVTAIVGMFTPTCFTSQLTMSDCKMFQGQIKQLSHILIISAFLTIFDLSENLICKSDAEALGNALKTNTSLKELNLACCKLTDDEGGYTIAECLSKNTTLIKLNLRGNCLSSNVLLVLCESSVEILDFSWNNLSVVPVDIIPALKESCLGELCLYACIINDNGAMNILSGFNGKVLNLAFNSITNGGANAIAELLPSCPGLKELNVGNNIFDKDGISALVRKISEATCGITHFITTTGIPGFDSEGIITDDVGRLMAANDKFLVIECDFENPEMASEVATNCRLNRLRHFNSFYNRTHDNSMPLSVLKMLITMCLLMSDFSVQLPMRLIPYIMSFKTYGKYQELDDIIIAFRS